MTERILEFHDSTLLSIESSSTTALVLRLKGYIHEIKEAPGERSHTGWTQETVLVIENPIQVGRLNEGTLINDGSIRVGNTIAENWVALPFDSVGDVEITLGAGQEQLQVRGTRISASPHGAITFVEVVPDE